MTGFQEEKLRKAEMKRIRQLTAGSVLLIILGLVLVLGGCASYQNQDKTKCHYEVGKTIQVTCPFK